MHNQYESTFFQLTPVNPTISKPLNRWPFKGALLMREIKPPRPSAEVVGPHFSTISSAADLAARTMATWGGGVSQGMTSDVYDIYIYMYYIVIT